MDEELKKLLESAKTQGASDDNLHKLIDLYEADFSQKKPSMSQQTNIKSSIPPNTPNYDPDYDPGFEIKIPPRDPNYDPGFEMKIPPRDPNYDPGFEMKTPGQFTPIYNQETTSYDNVYHTEFMRNYFSKYENQNSELTPLRKR